MEFQLLSSELLMGDEERPTKLYVQWDNEKVRYITTDLDGSNHQYFESTKHPEQLTDEEATEAIDTLHRLAKIFFDMACHKESICIDNQQVTFDDNEELAKKYEIHYSRLFSIYKGLQ